MNRSMIAILVAALVSVVLLVTIGCESGAQTGAGIGAAAGAGIGQLAGRDTESTLIGGAVGGGVGYIIGNEQDKKKAKAEDEQLRDQMNIVTVNVTNSNGSVSPVTLKKQGVGYVGPRGEYYDHLPTSEELRPVYGF